MAFNVSSDMFLQLVTLFFSWQVHNLNAGKTLVPLSPGAHGLIGRMLINISGQPPDDRPEPRPTQRREPLHRPHGPGPPGPAKLVAGGHRPEAPVRPARTGTRSLVNTPAGRPRFHQRTSCRTSPTPEDPPPSPPWPSPGGLAHLSLIPFCRCRRIERFRSRLPPFT